MRTASRNRAVYDTATRVDDGVTLIRPRTPGPRRQASP